MKTSGKKSIFWRSLTCFFILGIALALAGSAEAFAQIPFLGNWRAVDVDGSYMLLNIGGPPVGPFRITWVDDYMTFCDGEEGIIRGTGTINESNIHLLETELVAECFESGESLAFHMTFRYHPLTRTLSSQYENGRVIIWRRSGIPLEVPSLNLRVNYGDDWVESFYEAEHTAWVTVTESDGWTVKATAEVFTAPRDEWEGAPGFQTTPEDWIPEMPDIQAGDWVYGWVDNGASAQVRIGEITGKISLGGDFITGTILTPWFSSELDMECHPWGTSEPVDMKYDTVMPDGEEPYTCSWEGEWDIQPGQTVGVGYSGLDGQWVANTFARDPHIIASESGNWFWTYGFNPGMLDISIYASNEEDAELLWSGQAEADEGGFAFVGGEVHEQDLVEGTYLVISDGLNTKDIVLLPIWVTVFDTENEIMAGYAPAGSEVWAAAGPQEWQERLMAMADGETGWWLVNFNDIGFDILDEYREWSFAQIFDEDWDANEGSTPPDWLNTRFTIFPEWEWYDAMDWPDGDWVTITVVGKEIPCTATKQSFGFFFNGGFPEGCDVEIGDTVRMTDGYTTLEHVVRNLAVTGWDVDLDTLTGIADEGTQVYVWPHEHDYALQTPTAGSENTWTADFSGVFDLDYYQEGRSIIYDDAGNGTAVDWNIRNPRFTIYPDAQWYDGIDWPIGALVTITVVDKPECTVVRESSVEGFNGGFPEDCFVTTGDMVTFSNGIMSNTHEVQNLAIMSIDKDAGIVSGIADTDAVVYAWVWELEDSVIEMTAVDGSWSADFGALGFELEYGMCAQAEIRDGQGNATSVDLLVENAHIVASITENWFYIVGFLPGATLDLSIYESEGGSLVWNQGWTADVNGFAWIEAGVHGWDLEPGNYLSVSDGTTTKELVIEAFTFDTFDLTTGILQGTVPGFPGRLVWVGIGIEGGNWVMAVNTDEYEDWVADFGMPVPPDYYWVAAQIFDGDGDASELRPATVIGP